MTTYQYYYTGDQLTVMTKGSTKLSFTHDAAGNPLTLTYNGTKYYYNTNLQGDVIGILDSSGAAVVTYIYDAWGRPYSITGTLASTLGADNPLRYRGYVYDTETGLYYLQSRYYNPEWGRFISADAFVSTGQGFVGNNMFAYCGNNPANRVDPTGNFFVDAARELLERWIYGDGSTQYFGENSAIVTALMKSKKMQEEIKDTTEKMRKYNKTHLSGTAHFKISEDGLDLNLAARRVSYSVYYQGTTTSTYNILGIQYTSTRHDYGVVVKDTYNFEKHEWDSFENYLNNAAFIAHQMGVGKDYVWYATFRTSRYECKIGEIVIFQN